jgi:hypothetical protein
MKVIKQLTRKIALQIYISHFHYSKRALLNTNPNPSPIPNPNLKLNLSLALNRTKTLRNESNKTNNEKESIADICFAFPLFKQSIARP